MRKLFLVALFLVAVSCISIDNPILSKLRTEDLEYYSSEIKQTIEENIQQALQFKTCDACLIAFNMIAPSQVIAIREKLRAIAIKICNSFMDKDVCQGVMVDYFNSFVENFFSRYLTNDHVCVFLKACETKTEQVDFEAWKQMVLADKPAQDKQAAPKNPELFRVLHFTDLHTDLEYEVGSLADCDQPFCCRPESGDAPSDESKQAKYWGSNAKCDLPLRTVEALLIDSKTKGGDIDMIVWTGDNTSHDVWHQDQKNQTLPQQKISELIEKHFPDVPKFPIFGNHECFPADQYDYTVKDSTRWVREQSANMWKTWLESEALISLVANGYYSQYDPKTNVRVIATNTQACDMLNFYLISNNTDPAAQLEFIRKELYIAEQNQQKVFLIGHIPFGDNTCSSQWAMRIQVLIDRFENTIIGQFYGHTHNDHIEVVKSATGEDRSVGTIFIAPSGTTYSYQSPSYRIFAYENEKVSNYFQYRLDLEKANKNTQVSPVWDLAYDLKSEYGLKDVSNNEIYNFAFKTLVNNKNALQKYVDNYWTGSQKLIPKINSASKTKYTCMAQNVVFDDRLKCFGIYALTSYPDELLYKLIQVIQGPWLIKKSN
ncbi:ser/thr phosphatase family protein (macronuclear) [Tetrahymena thermophila SB210]|uniref:Sphingomyelin phosphodiesterase n=1 Tax=Tetrahymena thermophila (strain SB210) TaxID=312017 RepID=Q22CB9_TETTS|nr:ser/thr phosphatase family protein [Tetrahymena thermophila SB210]EAR82947.2 ser/thr phosphatase family protein [Tetrahymena thermophila SB210]|eukprot:XP_001030610.2 ser/thr phosphatase family protein [Tetrahymena thermophila SB210]